ncbi:MAG: glycosyltransferase family 9 protein [Pirellulaceae bacterium]|nr:glycosyltransferase family 9 protein [Pirellulaceae bacterium]
MLKTKSIEPKRILICRLSAIGDCVLTIPLAVKAKELWPNCKLSWVVDCAAAQLLQSHPCIDEVIKIERHWVKNLKLWKTLRRELQDRKFDLTLDPQGLIKSGLLAWLSGAKARVGFDYSQARELAPLLANQRVARTQRHMVDTYLELLSTWSPTETSPTETGSAEFRMPVYEAAANVPSLMQASGFAAQELFACMTPGAGWASKLWPVDRFAEVARFLRSKHNLRSVVLWAGESEKKLADEIASRSQGAALVAPRTSLTELAEIARRAKLFLAGDTGPLHIAAAVGAPCVGLFGSTWADESGPYGPHNVAVQSPKLPGLRGRMRSSDNSAMLAIEVDEVCMVCTRVLNSEPHVSHYAA